MSRTLVATARLPWDVAPGDALGAPASAGSAAANLRPWFERAQAWWVGWPGGQSGLGAEPRLERDRRLADARMTAVELEPAEVDRFINGFTNRLLWPLFHYLLDRVPVDAHGWQAYQHVNARFADAVAGLYRDGDRIWVHDYQLLLLPALLRQRLPDARIGFFFHVPFPSSEVFRTLPWRSDLLNGVLGADLIGFQTFSHLRHFFSSILHIENIEMDIDRVRIDSRDVRLGVFPMGVDAGALGLAADAPDVLDAVATIRRDSGGRALGLALDRLDHATGIPRRLEALERLMHRQPDLRDRLRVFQVAIPRAEQSDAYRGLRREVEERVGRINGTYSTVRSVPLHYVHQRLSPMQVLALYRAADLMFVTPLRDGMSLAAKEFVAARTDEDGLLLLSEFAGAADELDGALMVNPYDVEGMASTIALALTMPVEERRDRMRTLRRRVATWDVHTWAARFLRRPRRLRVTASIGGRGLVGGPHACADGGPRRGHPPVARLRRHPGAARPPAGACRARQGAPGTPRTAAAARRHPHRHRQRPSPRGSRGLVRPSARRAVGGTWLLVAPRARAAMGLRHGPSARVGQSDPAHPRPVHRLHTGLADRSQVGVDRLALPQRPGRVR